MKKLILYFFITSSIFSNAQQSGLDSLKTSLKKAQSDSEKLKILEKINDKLINNNNPDESLEYYFSQLELSKKLNNTKAMTDAYRYMSESYMKLNDKEKALYYAENSFKINDSIKNIKGTLIDLNQIGRVYDYFRELEKAIQTYQKAINIYKGHIDEEEKFQKQISVIYGNLGAAYSKKGDFKNSIDSFLMQIKIADKYANYDELSKARYNLGWKYMEMGQYKKANEYFHLAIDTVNVKRKIDIIAVYHAMGINYSRWGKYKDALKYNKLALDFFKKTGDKIYEFDVLNNTAIVYKKMNEKDKALEYANQALLLANSLDDKKTKQLAMHGIYLTLVNIYVQFNEYNKANKLLKIVARDTIDTIFMNKQVKNNIFIQLYKVNKKLKKYKEALRYFERHKTINDSILIEQRDNKFTEIETKYQAEKKEKEIAKQKQVIATKELEKQKLRTGLFALSFFIIGLFILFIKHFRKYKKNKAELNKLFEEIKKMQAKLIQKDKLSKEKNSACNIKQFHKFLMKKYQIDRYELIDVWENIALGRSRKEYVNLKNTENKIGISENTIKAWIKELYKKLKKFNELDNDRYSDAKAVKEYYQNLINFQFSTDCNDIFQN